MANPGLVTEQGYAAGSFGFMEASEEDAKKLDPEKEKAEKDQQKEK